MLLENRRTRRNPLQRHSDTVYERRSRPPANMAARRFSREEKVERRSARRHPIEVLVQLAVGVDKTFHVTRDLAQGGAYFREAVPYPVGTQVRLSFKLPGIEKPIECEGEIVNVPKAGFGMGVRFLDLPEADALRIDKFAQNAATTDPKGKARP